MWQCEVVIDDRKKRVEDVKLVVHNSLYSVFLSFVFDFRSFFLHTQITTHTLKFKSSMTSRDRLLFTHRATSHSNTHMRARAQPTIAQHSHAHTHVYNSSRSSLARIAAPMTTTTSKYQKIIPRVFVFIIRKYILAASGRRTNTYAIRLRV